MIKVKTLTNGLRIVTEQIPYLQSVSMGILVKAGSADETPDIAGISHFIEHMMFKGTERRSARALAEDADKISAQMNAFTGKEATVYYIKALSDTQEEAADILLDMVCHSVYDPREMTREKGVVIEEMKMGNDTPDDVAHDKAVGLVYKDHVLGNPIIGKATTVRAVSREKLINYIDREYTLDSIVVSICGNFDEDKLIAMFEEELSARFKPSKEAKIQPVPEYVKGKKKVHKDIEQAHLCLAVRGVNFEDERYYGLQLVNAVMGYSMSSRLFQNIREQQGLAYSVYSIAQSYQMGGYYYIYAGVNQNKIDAALNGIRHELDVLKKDGFTKEEYEMAKTQVKGNYIFGQENIFSRMYANGKNLLIMGKTYELEETIAEIEATTFEDMSVAAEMINDYSQYSQVIVTK